MKRILCVFCKTDTAEERFDAVYLWVECERCRAIGPKVDQSEGSMEQAKALWLNLGQEWTKTTPTKSGYYWLIEFDNTRTVEPCEVDAESGRYFTTRGAYPLKSSDGWCAWMGPLYPPLGPTNLVLEEK